MTDQQTRPIHEQQSFGDDEIDLGRLFGLLVDHKWWIAIVTAVFALVGATYSILATPIFQGDSLVHVERRSSVVPFNELSDLFGEGSETQTSAEVQILQSRMVLGQVVDGLELDLVVVPRNLPLVGDLVKRRDIGRPRWLSGTPWVWGGEHLEVGLFEVAESLRGHEFLFRVEAPGRFSVWDDDHRLGEGAVGETLDLLDGSLRLRVARLTAAAGAEFHVVRRPRLTTIRSLGQRLNVAEVGGGRGSSTGMLRLTLTGSDRVEIRRSLEAVTQTFLTQNVERQSAQAQRSIEFLEQQAPELRTQLADAEDRLNQYRVDLDSVDLSSESQAVLDQYIELERRLSELEFQEAELAERFTEVHPRYQSLVRQRTHLQQQRQELNDRLNQLPAAQQEVVRLNRDVQVTQAIYVNVLNRLQELRVARAGTIGNVRVIDTPEVGPAPIQPRRTLIVALATMLGGMLAVGGVFMKGLLFRGVESPDEIEQLGLAVYATVPKSESQDNLIERVSETGRKVATVSRGLLAHAVPTDNAVEAIRGLRTSLHFAMLEADNNHLAIVGPSPGVGKSFVTANLGAVCAMSGQKVLLIDADMRKGHMHTMFGAKSGPGLSDVLARRESLDAAILSTDVDGLSFLARGNAPPNPSELLMQEAFSELLESAGDTFDLVLIDTPPVLAVTDAAIVSALCGTSLMVARFQQNTAKEVQAAVRRLENSGGSVRGIILNAMERKASAYYGYYGYYNYTYK